MRLSFLASRNHLDTSPTSVASRFGLKAMRTWIDLPRSSCVLELGTSKAPMSRKGLGTMQSFSKIPAGIDWKSVIEQAQPSEP